MAVGANSTNPRDRGWSAQNFIIEPVMKRWHPRQVGSQMAEINPVKSAFIGVHRRQ
jgi:hypothetical protein